MAGWFPLDVDAWPDIVSGYHDEWPRAAMLMDLRWWSDAVKMGRADRIPTSRALCERWKCSHWRARQVMKAEGEWKDPAAQTPHSGRTNSAQIPHKTERSKAENASNSAQTPHSGRTNSAQIPQRARTKDTHTQDTHTEEPSASRADVDQIVECFLSERQWWRDHYRGSRSSPPAPHRGKVDRGKVRAALRMRHPDTGEPLTADQVCHAIRYAVRSDEWDARVYARGEADRGGGKVQAHRLTVGRLFAAHGRVLRRLVSASEQWDGSEPDVAAGMDPGSHERWALLDIDENDPWGLKRETHNA